VKTIFREYDIRGIFDRDLDEPTVEKIGYFFAEEVKRRKPGARYIAVGYDARLHSPSLYEWLGRGINKAGVAILETGMAPTPVNYFANYVEFDGLKSDASVMITGSHNPPEYNGFKMTIDRRPFFGEEITALGQRVLHEEVVRREVCTDRIPVDAKGKYIRYLLESFAHLDLSGKRFIFDCGNGAAGAVLREVLEGLHIDAEILYEEPDGRFPNHHPDPSDESTLEELRKRLETGAYTLGFAYDGDADRLAVLSRNYNFKGDILAIFFARRMDDPLVIGEVKCSQLMYDTIGRFGRTLMYKTGHSNLKVEIARTGASLAAEVSGHLFFNDRYFGYDDAIYSTMRMLELMDEGMDPDSELRALPTLFTTEEITIDVEEEEKFEKIDRLKEMLKDPPEGFPPIREIIEIDGVRVVFEKGWGLVRASNTTPKIVTRFEATDRKFAEEYRRVLMKLLENI